MAWKQQISSSGHLLILSASCLVSAFLWQSQCILNSPKINRWPLLVAIGSTNPENTMKKCAAFPNGFHTSKNHGEECRLPHLSYESGCMMEWISSWSHITNNFLVWNIISLLSLSNDKIIKIHILNSVRYFIRFITYGLTIYKTNAYILYSCAIIWCYWQCDLKLLASDPNCFGCFPLGGHIAKQMVLPPSGPWARNASNWSLVKFIIIIERN